MASKFLFNVLSPIYKGVREQETDFGKLKETVIPTVEGISSGTDRGGKDLFLAKCSYHIYV
ncbi:hypothetical protein [Salinimicrobium marinum]|uniref:hypothetical protein n=1 Tax=Salinimicrobium marinum TaxID=680283 RepID=UPI001673DECA|nr:hypothetical protein [Salinimicrobium marinum]